MRLHLSVSDRRLRSQLTKTLKSLGVTEITTSRDVPWTSGRVGSEGADAVIAILSGARDQLAPEFLEIGFATARHSPLLVLADEPSFADILPNVTVLLGGLSNTPALKFHLDTFLESVRRPFDENAVPTPVQPSSTDWAQDELRDIRSIENPGVRAELFEQLVEQLLRKADANVVAHDRYGRGQFDFAVSVPGTDFGPGPIAIECKSVRTSQAVASAARKLQAAVIERGAAIGVVLFDEQALEGATRAKPIPMVVIIGIDELIGGLRAKSLGHVLSEARNRAVHAP